MCVVLVTSLVYLTQYISVSILSLLRSVVIILLNNTEIIPLFGRFNCSIAGLTQKGLKAYVGINISQCNFNNIHIKKQSIASYLQFLHL